MRLIAAFGCFAVAACGTVEPRGVDLVAHSVATSDHRSEALVRVAFLPTPESCSPQDLIATRTLARLERDRQDVAVLTVIPAGLPADVGMNGQPFPGRVLDLPLHTLKQSELKVRRPRFEVYGRDGQLLLLRPVYPYEEERLLYEELLNLLRFAGNDTS